MNAVDKVTGYHAHVYYDAETKPIAAEIRAALETGFDVKLGRWHDSPIGPHPCGSYQIAFAPSQFARLVPWLAHNRRGLTVFIHPEGDDVLADHSDHAMWLGTQRELNLDALR